MLSWADGDVVRRDTRLRGLETALDPEAFVHALRAALPEAGIREASAGYVRYKPGTNCVVAYRLETNGAPLDAYIKVHANEDWIKLVKARERASVPTIAGPGRVGLEDGNAVVVFFPNDDKLQSLHKLGQAETRRKLLEKLFSGQPELWEGEMQKLRYKPERRYVAVWRAGGRNVAVLKAYVGGGYEAARASAQAFESRGPLRLARLLGRRTRHGVLAFEWLEGRLLSEIISAPDFHPSAVTTAGAALVELHAQQPRNLVRLERKIEAARLRRLARWMGDLWPRLAHKTVNLARRIAEQLLITPDVSAPAHGDFYAQQVLVADGMAAILDLDRAACADPARDLGTFIAHVERDSLRGDFSPNRAAQVKEALLEGYRHQAGNSLPRRISLHAAAGLLWLAPEPFRYRELDWPERTEAIIERAEQILRGGALED
ncbi:MAG: aminoglycoside phosphotransferase family protein [Acidobacteriota bacterium]|nr:aminoglycoside phosphotransferase family protein [Acidobacteriota bacterium]